MNMPTFKPLVLAVLLLASPALMAAAKTWKLNLKDADISALINEMSTITGKNFVIDPRVKGKVSVVSSRAMSADALYELFQSVLAINGFAAVPAGPVIKILPDTNGRQSGVRLDLSGTRGGEQLVTRVIVLQQAPANEMVTALRPMMPQAAHLAAVPGANAVILSDRATNADAMESIIRELDTGRLPDDAIEIIPVRNGRAVDMMNVLESLEGAVVSTTTSGGKSQPSAPGRVRIIADERSNRLLVRGDRALRERVRILVRTLDEAPDSGDDTVRVFRLKFANARQVAEVLKGILATQADKPVTTTAAAPGAAPSSTNLTGGAMPPVAGRGATTTIMIGSSSLIADETQNALIARANPRQIRQIEAVLADLDRRRAQVLIQAAIVEVSGDNAAQLGVQWAYGDPSTGVGLINFNNAGASVANIGAAVLAGNPALAGIGNGAAVAVGAARNSRSFIGALIQALNTVSDANLLSTPSIMTLDNQEAKIVVGQNVPFITGSTATSAAGVTNPFTTIQRQDVGITLKVTPSLSEGGVVKLEVEQEVSAVVPNAVGINSADLITSKRSIKTSILADDGQTIVLGGLVQDDVKKSISKVPLLGDIPVMGALFRSTSESRSKRNLLVFLQPSIIRDAGAASVLTERQYNSVRRVDLGLDAQGQLTRLPVNIQDIYQGGVQRESINPSAPASESRPVERQRPLPAPVVPREQYRESYREPSREAYREPVRETYQPAVRQESVREEPVRRYAPADSLSYPEPARAQRPVATSESGFGSTPTSARPSPGYRGALSTDDFPARTASSAERARYYYGGSTPQSAAPQARPAADVPAPKPGTKPILTKSGNVYYVPDAAAR